MMDSSIRNQLTADGTSVSLENLVREKSLEVGYFFCQLLLFNIVLVLFQ
jgi:hypothetical protein